MQRQILQACVILLLAAGSLHATVHCATGNIKTTLLDKVKYLQRNTGGPDLYQPPTAAELEVWRLVMFNIYIGNIADAAELIGTIGPKYRVVHFTDTSDTPRSYYVLLEADVSETGIVPTVDKGWGAYVFDPAPVRELALQVPHPLADDNTEEEGIEGLLVLRPRALLLFTSHRCASLEESVQPTNSTPCDEESGYHMSDASHAASSADPPVTNPFQVAHEELFKLYQSIGIQFHGNGRTSDCPKLFLSNTGDDGFVIPSGNVTRLQSTLLTRFPGEVRTYDGDDTCPLAGTENLQGRYSNDPTLNPVLDSPPAPDTVERFIHVEQLRAGVRDEEANRLLVLEAIADAFAPIRRVRSQITSQ